MRKEFFEYFPKQKREIEDLWKNSLIVFDASFLLNIYRYSKNTKDDLIKLLMNLSDRLWIPHQACYEFLKNRLKVIDDQVKIYEDAIKQIEGIYDTFNKNIKNPFIEKNLLDKFIKLLNEIKNDLNEKRNEYSCLIDDDKYLIEIADLFENKVGKPFNEEAKDKLIELGKKRFDNKIPPGYQDAKKSEQDRYGDLFLWKQIIKQSLESKMNVIFITDDLKDDWWEILC